MCLAAAVPVAQADQLSFQDKALLNRSKMLRDGVITLPQAEKTPLKDGRLPMNQRSATGFMPSQAAGYARAFVRMAEGSSEADLEAAGMTVLTVKGDIAIVSVPLDEVEKMASRDCVKTFSLERPLNAKMDLAREASGIDVMQKGTGLNMPYTGKGVLAAVIDQGVDPNHIAFFDEEGNNRIQYLTFFDGTAGSDGNPKTQYYGHDIIYQDDKGNTQKYPEVTSFYTDDVTAYHGTHTLNILGGSYFGNVTVNQNGSLTEVPNSFYGVAPEADLAVSCGDLSDACVAMGLAEIIAYADYRKESEGMPSIVSMSLGSSTGAHDPKSPMNDFLAYCGEETIIVVSAGNEGNLKIAYNETFTPDKNSFKTLIYPYGFRYDPKQGEAKGENNYIRNGIVYVYSDSDTPFIIQGFLMTGTPGNYRKRATFLISEGEGNYYLSDSGYADYVGGAVNTNIAKYFDGFVGGGTMLDKNLGRYYGAFDYYLVTNPETGINPDGSEAVIIGFEVIGTDGQRIDCYCDGVNTWLSDYGMDDYVDGTTDGTISDMAVGDNVLVVGAYTTRNDWTALDGVRYTYEEADGFKIGEVGEYSSYGTLPDGSTLPHICAPGSAVMSAVSNPWTEYYFKGYESYIPKNNTAMATIGDKKYYWKPETGTSMATPLVAGGIALWLEANPDLTIDDVKDIIAKTAVRDAQVEAGNPARWGAGKFDALAGLKEVISRSDAGVEGLTVDDRNDRLILSEEYPGCYNVFVGSARQLNIEVYSIAGGRVVARNVSGNQTTIDLSNLSKGIYVLKVNKHSTKIYIK